MAKSTEKNSGSDSPFASVAVVGLGLLGGSLALALKRHCPRVHVLGLARRAETIEQALAQAAIDLGATEAREILPQAELTVVCLPINASLEFCRRHLELWRGGAVVTDVGSTKQRLVEAVRPLLLARSLHFVGGHPMAGSEKSGFAAATEDLYRNAPVFLTPLPDDDPETAAKLADFWRAIGANPAFIEPAAHDALVARTSHLPHLLAPALVSLGLRSPQAALATGGAFRDMTRIAAGSPDMWCDIFEHNREQVIAAIDEFLDDFGTLRQALQDGRWADLKQMLEQARQRRIDWQRDRP